MTTNVTGTNVYTSPVIVPANGEAVDGAGLVVSAQGLANQIEHTRQRLLGVATNYKWELPLQYPWANTNTRFTVSASGYWEQTSVADGGPIYFQAAPMPAFGTIKEVHLEVANVVHGAFPAVRPFMNIFKHGNILGDAAFGSGGGTGPLGASYASDPTVAIADYDNVHLISVTGLSEVLTDYNRYMLVVSGESGANSLVGFKFARAWLVIGP